MSGVEAEGWRQLITPLTLAQKLPLPYGDQAAYKTPNALGPQVGGNKGCRQIASLPAFVHNFPATAWVSSLVLQEMCKVIDLRWALGAPAGEYVFFSDWL